MHRQPGGWHKHGIWGGVPWCFSHLTSGASVDALKGSVSKISDTVVKTLFKEQELNNTFFLFLGNTPYLLQQYTWSSVGYELTCILATSIYIILEQKLECAFRELHDVLFTTWSLYYQFLLTCYQHCVVSLGYQVVLFVPTFSDTSLCNHF